jgi:hypothetical protein
MDIFYFTEPVIWSCLKQRNSNSVRVKLSGTKEMIIRCSLISPDDVSSNPTVTFQMMKKFGTYLSG